MSDGDFDPRQSNTWIGQLLGGQTGRTKESLENQLASRLDKQKKDAQQRALSSIRNAFGVGATTPPTADTDSHNSTLG